MAGDIADPTVVAPLVAQADAVVNFAAESHVDRSILEPVDFLRTDVLGVHVLLEACRHEQERARTGGREAAPRLPAGLHRRGLRLRGNGGKPRGRQTRPALALLRRQGRRRAARAQSYFVTYGLDAVVTRGSNTYGPYHYPEKLIPLFVTNAIDDQPLPLYGDGLQRRDWLYVADHAGAIDFVLEHGAPGEVYNVPAGNERTNREVVAALPRAPGQALVAGALGRGSARPRPPLRHGRRQAGGPGLAPEHHLRGRAWPRRSTGSAPTRPGGGRSSRASGDDYYRRQYGARLAGSRDTG